MPFILVVIAGILIVSAFRNTQGQLATALEQDVPGFVTWGAAVGAVAGIGFIPGLREISRWLLALVFVVLVVKYYQQILNGFTGLSHAGSGPVAAAPTDPGTAFAAGQPVTPGEIAGTSGAPGTISLPASTGNANPLQQFNPSTILTAFEETTGLAGFGGFV